MKHHQDHKTNPDAGIQLIPPPNCLSMKLSPRFAVLLGSPHWSHWLQPPWNPDRPGTKIGISGKNFQRAEANFASGKPSVNTNLQAFTHKNTHTIMHTRLRRFTLEAPEQVSPFLGRPTSLSLTAPWRLPSRRSGT